MSEKLERKPWHKCRETDFSFVFACRFPAYHLLALQGITLHVATSLQQLQGSVLRAEQEEEEEQKQQHKNGRKDLATGMQRSQESEQQDPGTGASVIAGPAKAAAVSGVGKASWVVAHGSKGWEGLLKQVAPALSARAGDQVDSIFVYVSAYGTLFLPRGALLIGSDDDAHGAPSKHGELPTSRLHAWGLDAAAWLLHVHSCHAPVLSRQLQFSYLL